MKKALIGFLILALSAGVFAQEEKEQGLQFGGALKTGIQFQTSDADAETPPGGKYDPSIRLYNDDAGEETRFDLNGSYTKDNYGVVFRLRTNKVISISTVEVNQAYVWADFLNEIINVKMGKIDDSTWKTGGDEGFHYSTGSGLRLEVKPIEGLNVGLFLKGPDGSPLTTAGHNGKTSPATDIRVVLDGIFAKEFLMETSFGAKYESDLFDFAAGLRIDSKADGLTVFESDYDNIKSFQPKFTPLDPPATPQFSENKDADKGMGAYAGFAVKAVPNLTAAVEARFNNLGDYGKYGWIWINETLGYAITEQLEAGLVMHQYLFSADAIDPTDSPYLKFKPYVSYALNGKWTVGLDVPVGLWNEVVDYDIGVKPKLSYQVGENASINGWYQFGYLQKTGEDDPVMTNTVQIDFIWTF